MSRRASAFFAAATLLGGLLAHAGCSSSKASNGTTPPPPVEAGPVGCQPSSCSAGNQCIDDGSGKGASCHKVCTQQGECPFGWYCNDGAVTSKNGASWCVQSTTQLAQGTGQWGTPCLPAGGEGSNSACDTADGFICLGTRPTDANAYCTIAGCSQDSDCPGGWWCKTADVAPNVTTATRSFGQTRTVCVPRDYCAPCTMDHDCPPTAGGTPQHCLQVASSDGGTGGGFCTPQCAATADCALDATCNSQYTVCQPASNGPCQTDDDCPASNGTYQHCLAGQCTPECASQSDCGGSQKCDNWALCVPRAQECVGSGNFCDPCRSDADCTQGGTCVYADYSTERYCSVPVTTGSCPTSTQAGAEFNNPSTGQCPPAPAGSPASDPKLGAVACSFTKNSYVPTNQCVAFTSISDGNGGETSVFGCWSANR